MRRGLVFGLGSLLLGSFGTLQAGEDGFQDESFNESHLLRFPEEASPEWGISMGLRTASIPFATEDDVVSDIFPNFHYEGERFFLRGLEGGIKTWKGERWGLDLIGRYRFFDIPEDYQNAIRGDAFDMGLQAYWMLGGETRLEAELLSDTRGQVLAAARLTTELKGQKWLLTPELEVRFKTSDFNTR